MKQQYSSKRRITEPSASVEIGGYAHLDAGRVKTKLYVSDVNQPLKIDAAELTKQMKKIRVTMNVEEDKSVSGDCVYEKDVYMIQESSDGYSTPGQMTSQSDGTPMPEGTNEDPSPLKVLKNFVDNIASDNRTQWVLIFCCGLIAVAAIVIATMR